MCTHPVKAQGVRIVHRGQAASALERHVSLPIYSVESHYAPLGMVTRLIIRQLSTMRKKRSNFIPSRFAGGTNRTCRDVCSRSLMRANRTTFGSQ